MAEGAGAEGLCSPIGKSARLVDAPFSRDKVWSILSAFERGFSDARGVISLNVVIAEEGVAS
ncbi:hypothetical protein O7599_33010 [Streptomyces sp. WMMC500]|uniref:hypothetical protein n=1 Tax=Streptomyces sp. WMMC500 TaxID=3015154 RepID=UPI00248C7249|nr:hypothetical protein [Streptomyces sp. WMMC500]WBB60288.1 hypothetical protein O7599_33010 [Streptomyces sp. WMMC500]